MASKRKVQRADGARQAGGLDEVAAALDALAALVETGATYATATQASRDRVQLAFLVLFAPPELAARVDAAMLPSKTARLHSVLRTLAVAARTSDQQARDMVALVVGAHAGLDAEAEKLLSDALQQLRGRSSNRRRKWDTLNKFLERFDLDVRGSLERAYYKAIKGVPAKSA